MNATVDISSTSTDAGQDHIPPSALRPIPAATELRECFHCHRELPENQFRDTGRGRLSRECRSCRNARMRRNNAENARRRRYRVTDKFANEVHREDSTERAIDWRQKQPWLKSVVQRNSGAGLLNVFAPAREVDPEIDGDHPEVGHALSGD